MSRCSIGGTQLLVSSIIMEIYLLREMYTTNQKTRRLRQENVSLEKHSTCDHVKEGENALGISATHRNK